LLKQERRKITMSNENTDSKMTLAAAYEKLLQAVCPEDIFGEITEPGEAGKDQIKKIYRDLSKVVHPDLYESNRSQKEMAKDAFQILNTLHEKAEKSLEEGTYGLRIPSENRQASAGGFTIKTQKREYIIQSALATGDLETIYAGTVIGVSGLEGKVAVKIVLDPADNDLAFNEIKVLKIFQAQPSQQSKHLPVLLDNFKTTENQYGLILRYFDGYDLYSVREKYEHGLDPRHVAWILARSLSAIGYAHSQDIIHGNLEPAHILVRPRDHNIMLVDWSYACVNPLVAGDSFKVYNEPYSPPEVAEKKPPLPSSDLYSLGKTMIYLLGGDPKTNFIPLGVPGEFKQLLQAMVLPSPLQRPRDAWELYRYLGELRTKIWGASRFLELSMNNH